MRQKVQFPRKRYVIKKGLFTTYSNASIIKVILTMKPCVLPHEARLVVPWGQSDLMDVALFLAMYGNASMNRRGHAGLC
jgi:hypothetical protein